jgi:hypothetical protein
MKNYFTLLLLSGMSLFAQQKSTGVLNLNANMTAKIDLDQATSLVTITITNPTSSWFGLGFNSTATIAGNGMPATVDCVVMRSATNLSDSRTRVSGSGNPDVDPIQDWTIVSNSAPGVTRTIVATRPFNTGDSNDLVFDYNATSLNLIYASPASGNFTLVYHGSSPNRGSLSAPLTTLGVEDFSLNATQIYPNPSKGDFVVKTKSGLDKINVYSHVGAFVKTININSLDAVELNIGDLSSGVYLLELVNKGDKSWKKVVLE